MSRKLHFAFIVILMSVCIAQLHAQLVVQGVVTDKEKNPIPGAAIMIQGTSLGTNSNLDGSYKLEIPKLPKDKNTLEVKYVGYKTIRETLEKTSGQITLNFVLVEDILQLDQVVVTGNAEPVEKKSLGNSLSTLSAKDLEKVGTIQIDAALSGKIAGAMVQQNSGMPGGGTSIRLRGLSTLYSGTSDPLYIVDGIIVDNSSTQLIDLGGNTTNRIADLDPEDIDHMEIVKGAAAAALYGSRANNGVVQIFTKRGQAGQTKVRFNTTFGFDHIGKKLDYIKYPYMKYTDSTALVPVTRYDFQDEVFQTAARGSANLSISGGDLTTKYFVSGSWVDQEGIIKSQEYIKQSIRFNLDKIFTNWFTASLSTNYIHSINHMVANGGAYNNGFGVLTAITNCTNTYNYAPDANGIYPLAGYNPANRANPLDVINNWKAPEEINRYIGGLRLMFEPIKGLSAQYRFGYDTYTQNDKYYIPRVSSQTLYPNGYSMNATLTSLALNSNVDVVYNTDVTSYLKSTSAAGIEYTQSKSDVVSASTQDLTPFVELVNGSSSYNSISETKDERRAMGYYAQQTFNYKNLWYVTGSIRADGSSTFGADERWQAFPKYSTSYNISDNDFWKDNFSNIVSYFKIRGAYGFSGGQPASSFGRLTNYEQTTYNGMSGIVNATLVGNDKLKPERMREWELGTDMEFIGGKIGLEFTYYNKRVEDLIMEAPISASTGYSYQYQNVGILSNKGIEVMLKTVNFDLPSFTWTSSLTVSTSKPIIDKLYAGKQITISWYQTVLCEGKAPSTFYQKKLDWTKLDAKGLPTKETTSEYLGDPNPKLMWSFTNEFSLWNNLSVRIMFDAQMDYKMLDWNSRNMMSALYPNSPLYEKEYTGQVAWGYCARMSSAIGEFVRDASFVKLREVSISYTIRNYIISSLGLNNIQVSLIGRNLLTITPYSGYDPEINGAGQDAIVRGFDFATEPIPRSIIFSLTMNL